MSPGSAATLLAGRYRLDRQVAADRLGGVWHGTDLELARPVAVKLLHEDTDANAASQFLTAARRAASVEHEGLVRVFDCGEPEASESGRCPFLVMEYVDGQSLADLLHAGPLGAAKTIDLIAQVTAALQVAHEIRLVHGHIRPEKILLTRDGAAKLFGFSGIGAIGADLHALGTVARDCLGEHTSSGGADAPSGQPAASAAELIAELCAHPSADHADATTAIARRAAALRAQPGQLAAAGPGPAWSASLPATLQPHGLASPASTSTQPLPRLPARRGRMVTAAAAAIIVALVAVAIFGAVALNRSGRIPQAQGAAQAASVQVDVARLIGRPVNLVRLRLQRLGLVTRIHWRPSDSVSPGHVITVQPSGLVPVHSIVVIFGSSGPSATATTPGTGQTPIRHRHQSQPAKPSRSPTGSSTPAPSRSPSTSSTPSPSPSPSSSPAPSPSPSPSPSSAAPTNPPPSNIPALVVVAADSVGRPLDPAAREAASVFDPYPHFVDRVE